MAIGYQAVDALGDFLKEELRIPITEVRDCGRPCHISFASQLCVWSALDSKLMHVRASRRAQEVGYAAWSSW